MTAPDVDPTDMELLYRHHSTRLESFFQEIYHFPEDSSPPTPMPWGFTIYRTCYTPESTAQWETLLSTITRHVAPSLQSLCDSSTDPITASRIASHFTLDARSDPALDNLSIDDVRALYCARTGGTPMNADRVPWRVFFIADAEVLADPTLLKVAAAEYDATAGARRNPRLGRQRYFGWLRIPVGGVVGLWETLGWKFFDEIGESVRWEGPGAIWDPEGW